MHYTLHSKGDLTENKLILLYILYKMRMPLSLDQLTVLITEHDWMYYFDMRQLLIELYESGLIQDEHRDNMVLYHITTAGLDLLMPFRKRIPLPIREQIDRYIIDHRQELLEETHVLAQYSQDSSLEYPVQLKLIENAQIIFQMFIPTSSEEEAKGLCERFRREGAEVYARLVHELTADLPEPNQEEERP